jgi:hypothetical protein
MDAEHGARGGWPDLSLRETQAWLQAAITNHAGTLQDAAAEAVATPSSSLGARERIEIYRRMHLARLVEVLEDDYPAVRHQLGERAFREMTADYASLHPPRSYTLARFGDRLPDHLAEHGAGADGPLVSELARFEAALNRAFDAEPADRLSPEDVARIPFEQWASTRLLPVPSLELLSLRYEVGRHVAAAVEGASPPPPRRRRTFVAVYQREWSARWMRVSRPAFAVLTALCGGSSLADALAIGVEALPASRRQRTVFEWFREWFGEGLFRGIEKSGPG